MAIRTTPPTQSRRGKRQAAPFMSEINVTPMVDVMLVLLVVFMVAAPLLSVGVPVDLPQAQSQSLPQDEKPLVITIDKQGGIYVEETKISAALLIPRLQTLADNSTNKRIYVRGDAGAQYGDVAEIIARINSAGFTRVALVTQRPRN